MTYCYIHSITCVPVGLCLLVLLHSMMKDDLLLTLMCTVAISVQGKPPCQHVYVCIGVIMNKSMINYCHAYMCNNQKGRSHLTVIQFSRAHLRTRNDTSTL